MWQPPQTDGYVIIDGHGRYNALKFLEKKGYTIPDVPIVIVHAENEQEAKKKLLEVGNMNGLIDFDQFEEFTKDLELDLIFFLTMIHRYYGTQVMIIWDRLPAHVSAQRHFDNQNRRRGQFIRNDTAC